MKYNKCDNTWTSTDILFTSSSVTMVCPPFFPRPMGDFPDTPTPPPGVFPKAAPRPACLLKKRINYEINFPFPITLKVNGTDFFNN